MDRFQCGFAFQGVKGVFEVDLHQNVLISYLSGLDETPGCMDLCLGSIPENKTELGCAEATLPIKFRSVACAFGSYSADCVANCDWPKASVFLGQGEQVDSEKIWAEGCGNISCQDDVDKFGEDFDEFLSCYSILLADDIFENLGA